MRAGLVSKRLSFREVFVAVPERILFVIAFIGAVALGSGRVKDQKNGSVTTIDGGTTARTNFSSCSSSRLNLLILSRILLLASDESGR